jgi:hypothetical protein
MAQFDDAVTTLKRVSHRGCGTALTASNFALSAGFGTTATVSAVTTGSTDACFQITITSAGTGQGASPTCTLTFADGVWRNEATGAAITPIATLTRNGGSQLTVNPTWTATSTTLVITFPGTPVAAETYVIAGRVTG